MSANDQAGQPVPPQARDSSQGSSAELADVASPALFEELGEMLRRDKFETESVELAMEDAEWRCEWNRYDEVRNDYNHRRGWNAAMAHVERWIRERT